MTRIAKIVKNHRKSHRHFEMSVDHQLKAKIRKFNIQFGRIKHSIRNFRLNPTIWMDFSRRNEIGMVLFQEPGIT